MAAPSLAQTLDRSRNRTAQVLALALVLRCAVACPLLVAADAVTRASTVDTQRYLELARSIAIDGRFVFAGVPELKRTPGYPLFLVPAVWTGNALTIVPLQILLGCATVYLVMLLARALSAGERVATWAGLALAVEPLSVVYPSVLLSETLHAFFLAAFALAIAVYLRRRSTRTLVAAALCSAAAVYVRPVTVFLPLLVAAAIALGSGGLRVPTPVRVRHAAVYLTVFVALTVPWVIRNGRVTGYYALTSMLDRRAAIGYGGAIDAARFTAPRAGEVVSADRYRQMRTDAVRAVIQHPGAAAQLFASGFVRLFIDPGAAMYLQLWNVAPIGLGAAPLDSNFAARLASTVRARPFVVAFEGVLLLVFASYVVVGIYALRIAPRPHRGVLWFALGTCAYLAVVSAAPGGGGRARLRHPMMPFVALLAGYGIAHVRQPAAHPLSAGALEDRVA